MTLLKVAEPVYVLIVLHRLIDRYRQERDFCLHLETEHLFLLKFTSRLNGVLACIVGGADARSSVYGYPLRIVGGTEQDEYRDAE